MSQHAYTDPSKPVGKCTVDEIFEHLCTICPTVVLAAHIATDTDWCDTQTFARGNRAACLGFIELMKARSLAAFESDRLPIPPKDDQ